MEKLIKPRCENTKRLSPNQPHLAPGYEKSPVLSNTAFHCTWESKIPFKLKLRTEIFILPESEMNLQNA